MTVTARRLMVATSLVSLLMTGCTTAPPDEQISVADSSEALGYETNQWQTPFWERERAEDSASEGNRVARTPPPPSDGNLRPNIGIVFGDDVAPDMETGLRAKAAANGFQLIPNTALRDATERLPECSDLRSLACAKALAIYPGIRLLMIVDNRNMTLIDASAGVAYPATRLPGNDPSDAALQLALERSSLSPWVLRAFHGDDGRLYIGAGRINGIKEGTELTVHKPGNLVRAPSGQPMTWRPGNLIGKARVIELVGPNLAVITGETGPALTPDMALLVSP